MEITSLTSLLDEDGMLAVQGWARRPLIAYNSHNLPKKARTSERESIHITNRKKGYEIALLFQDEPMRSIHSIIYTDLKAKACCQTTVVSGMGKGRCRLPASHRMESFTTFQSEDASLVMTAVFKTGVIYLVFNAPSLRLPDGTVGLLGDFAIDLREPEDSINAASGVDGMRKSFHLAQRHLPLSIKEGFVRRGGTKDYLVEDGALAMTDSVRRRALKGEPLYNAFALSREISFNLGYGCEKLMSAAILEHRTVKLGQIDFNLHGDMMKPWLIKEDAGRFEAVFVPSFVQRLDSYSNLEVIGGAFTGQVYDEDGQMTGFRDLGGTVLRHRS